MGWETTPFVVWPGGEKTGKPGCVLVWSLSILAQSTITQILYFSVGEKYLHRGIMQAAEIEQ